MNQTGSSRIDAVLKMLLISFISLLAFLSGVYFGRELTASDYQAKALESDFNRHGDLADSSKSQSSDSAPDNSIADEEVAALSEQLVNEEKGELAAKATKDGTGEEKDKKSDGRGVASTLENSPDLEHADHENGTHGSTAAAKAAGHSKADLTAHDPDSDKLHDASIADSHKSPLGHKSGAKIAANSDQHAGDQNDQHAHKKSSKYKPDLTAAHKAAVRVAQNSVPIDNPKAQVKNRIPNSLPRTAGSSTEVEFTVQVASYPTADAAKEHADELVKKGFPAFPVEATINGRTWYRVSVGSFKDMKAATAYRGTLIKQADVEAAIVQRIQR